MDDLPDIKRAMENVDTSQSGATDERAPLEIKLLEENSPIMKFLDLFANESSAAEWLRAYLLPDVQPGRNESRLNRIEHFRDKWLEDLVSQAEEALFDLQEREKTCQALLQGLIELMALTGLPASSENVVDIQDLLDYVNTTVKNRYRKAIQELEETNRRLAEELEEQRQSQTDDDPDELASAEKRTINSLTAKLARANERLERINAELTESKEKVEECQQNLVLVEGQLKTTSAKLKEKETGYREIFDENCALTLKNSELMTKMESLEAQVRGTSDKLKQAEGIRDAAVWDLQQQGLELEKLRPLVEDQRNNIVRLRKERDEALKNLAVLKKKTTSTVRKSDIHRLPGLLKRDSRPSSSVRTKSASLESGLRECDDLESARMPLVSPRQPPTTATAGLSLFEQGVVVDDKLHPVDVSDDESRGPGSVLSELLPTSLDLSVSSSPILNEASLTSPLQSGSVHLGDGVLSQPGSDPTQLSERSSGIVPLDLMPTDVEHPNLHRQTAETTHDGSSMVPAPDSQQNKPKNHAGLTSADGRCPDIVRQISRSVALTMSQMTTLVSLEGESNLNPSAQKLSLGVPDESPQTDFSELRAIQDKTILPKGICSWMQCCNFS